MDTGLKTVMDFNLAFIVPDAFNEANDPSDGASKGLFNIYVSLANDFLYEDTENILIFLDNHDLSRFARKDDVGLDKYRQGVAFILTTRGIPQIYYGTELLFTGTKNEGDGIIRKDMPGGWQGDERSVFTSEGRTDMENEAWNYMSTILNWRKTSEAVKHGDLIQYAPLREYGDCYVYARIKGDETVLVVLNGSDKATELEMGRYSDVIRDYAAGTDVVTGQTFFLTEKLPVPARGAYILELHN